MTWMSRPLPRLGTDRHPPSPSILATLLWLVLAAFALTSCENTPAEPIHVGVLYSSTGTMAASEAPVRDAVLLAIDELNAAGGLLDRPIVPVVADGRSDGVSAAREAERMIVEEGVSAIFGCWTSDCRRSVRPVMEQFDVLLYYVLQFEGLETSPNIVYLGATPSQQILPAVEWAFANLGRRFFLVGSDYVFPRAAHEIAKDHLGRLGAEVVGEEYVLLGGDDFGHVVEAIAAAEPDVILNTVNGDGNVALFAQLAQAGLTPEVVPTLSVSLSETELQRIPTSGSEGSYAAWGYFQSLDSSMNRTFVERFKDRYGSTRVTSDPIATAYSAVHLWADAVEAAGTVQTGPVRAALAGRRYHAPHGWIRLDSSNQHVWQHVRIGRIRDDGQFDVVWESNVSMRPESFPHSRSRGEWERYLGSLYTAWGGAWANPGRTP